MTANSREDGSGFGGSTAEGHNPFTLPSDEEVFRMRDDERRKRQQEREVSRSQKVWEKGVKGGIVTNRKLNNLLKATGQNIIESALSEGTVAAREQTAQATAGIMKDRRQSQDKESMSEFIAKKREMFLVQMSLDTKHEEIRKIEEKAHMKEEALKKSEQMLEEDALRFDTFLKENDKKAHEAIKRAERETKLKTDKVQEIKKLNQQIQMVQSDMNKHRDALQDCVGYKTFLDVLTPLEWFKQQSAIKFARQEARRVTRVTSKMKAWDDNKRLLMLQADEEEKRYDELLAKQGRVKKKSDKKGAMKSLLDSLPQQPKLENEPLTSSDEDIPMHFTNPTQLLDIFQALEEQNLFLIQNSQETEHTLDELKQVFKEAQKSLDNKAVTLQSNINQLVTSIKQEEARSNQIKKRISASSGDNMLQQEHLLHQLHTKVTDVYEKCGFDASSNPTTLYMLSDLEARLEDLLNAIGQMPEEYVVKSEKDKEKKRRERKRAEQQALHERLQEERNIKAIERSMQAPKKKLGRKVMTRIMPTRCTTIRDENKEEKDANDKDNDELKYFREGFV